MVVKLSTYLWTIGFSCYVLDLCICLGSANDVRLPFPKKRKDRPEYQETIGELSTLPEGLEVAVRADGKIRVIDSQSRLFPSSISFFNEYYRDFYSCRNIQKAYAIFF